HGVYSKVFKTVEEALNERNLRIEQEEIEHKNKILNEPILRNDDGLPIIIFFNENKEKIAEIIVDAHRYHELKLNTLHFSRNYACITINNVKMILSRYLL